MATKSTNHDDSKRVSAYIARAAPFARPILERVRKAFHDGCPDIEERIKWGLPSFEKNGIVGGMAAFKAHAAFGFWRGKDLPDPKKILRRRGTASFMAERVTDVADLPPHAVLVDYVRRAVRLNEEPAAKRRAARPAPTAPKDFAAALRRNTGARKTFGAFSPSHKRAYVDWIGEAKRPETRKRRIATALEWLEQGRRRNWKYASE